MYHDDDSEFGHDRRFKNLYKPEMRFNNYTASSLEIIIESPSNNVFKKNIIF